HPALTTSSVDFLLVTSIKKFNTTSIKKFNTSIKKFNTSIKKFNTSYPQALKNLILLFHRFSTGYSIKKFNTGRQY
ncbi:hypothetical protein ACS2BX_25635, partial [Bacillus cereus group sp. BceL300]|uniref:hypothetical protein n=1 Tax=Bacillus cereus group sp. BceL300 TaxID=3444985 RepID=UPI003F1FD911